jgi:hypothetical protein
MLQVQWGNLMVGVLKFLFFCRVQTQILIYLMFDTHIRISTHPYEYKHAHHIRMSTFERLG